MTTTPTRSNSPIRLKEIQKEDLVLLEQMLTLPAEHKSQLTQIILGLGLNADSEQVLSAKQALMQLLGLSAEELWILLNFRNLDQAEQTRFQADLEQSAPQIELPLETPDKPAELGTHSLTSEISAESSAQPSEITEGHEFSEQTPARLESEPPLTIQADSTLEISDAKIAQHSPLQQSNPSAEVAAALPTVSATPPAPIIKEEGPPVFVSATESQLKLMRELGLLDESMEADMLEKIEEEKQAHYANWLAKKTAPKLTQTPTPLAESNSAGVATAPSPNDLLAELGLSDSSEKMDMDASAGSADDLLAELGISAPTASSPATSVGAVKTTKKMKWKKFIKGKTQSLNKKLKPYIHQMMTVINRYNVWIYPLILFVGIMFIDVIMDFYFLWPRDQATKSFLSMERGPALQMMAGLNRSLNQLLAACMVCLIIALPLTANLYTPRLIRTLVSNPIILLTIILLLINNGNGIWTLLNFSYTELPYFQVYLTLFVFLVSAMMMVPYFVTILHYLDPYYILLSLEKQVYRIVDEVSLQPVYLAKRRSQFLDLMSMINSIILKSVDRSDRELALEGMRGQKRILDHYATHKKTIPKDWMEVDYFTFIGMSTIGVEEVNKRKIWLELYILRFISEVFTKSLNKMPDLASAVAELVYQIGMKFMNINDAHVMDLCMRFYNTFLLEAIDKRDVASIHNVFYQYRLFAEMTLSMQSVTVISAAENFRHYAHLAISRKLSQVRDTALYDLVHLAYVAKTYADDEQAYQALCHAILAFDIFQYPEEMGNVAKGKIIFAALLISIGDDQMLTQVLPQLKKLAPEQLRDYHDDLLVFNEKIQPEITDRFVSSAYLREEQVPMVQEVFHSLGYTAE